MFTSQIKYNLTWYYLLIYTEPKHNFKSDSDWSSNDKTNYRRLNARSSKNSNCSVIIPSILIIENVFFPSCLSCIEPASLKQVNFDVLRVPEQILNNSKPVNRIMDKNVATKIPKEIVPKVIGKPIGMGLQKRYMYSKMEHFSERTMLF